MSISELETLTSRLPAEVDIVHRVTKVYQKEKNWRRERSARLESKNTVVDTTNATNPAAGDQQPVILPFRSTSDAAVNPPEIETRLSRTDPLVDAPSIGPKTAARFGAIGIHKVADLLDAAPADVATRLATYWITADTVTQWQHQSTLMCQIGGLLCRDTQLLAGAGFDSAHSVAAAELEFVVGKVGEFAATTSGRRYLRGAAPPTADEIETWQQNAIHSVASKPQRRSA